MSSVARALARFCASKQQTCKQTTVTRKAQLYCGDRVAIVLTRVCHATENKRMRQIMTCTAGTTPQNLITCEHVKGKIIQDTKRRREWN